MDVSRPFETTQVASAKNDDNKKLQWSTDWFDAQDVVSGWDI